MARFEVEAGGKRYEVEAPSLEVAMSALNGDAASSPEPPSGARPGSRAYADWAAKTARERVAAGQDTALPQVSRDPNSAPARYDDALARVRATQFPDMTDAQWAEYSKAVLSPVNPTQQGMMGSTLGFGDEVAGLTAGIGAGARQLLGGGGSGFGQAFSDVQNLEQARYDLGKEQNGAVGQAAEIAGSLAAFAPARNAQGILPALAIGPQPAAPGFLKTALSSGTTGAIFGGVEGFGRAQGDLGQRVEGAKAGAQAGAIVGTAVPLGTEAIGLAGRLGYNAAAPVIRSAIDPLAEASRRVGIAVGRDRSAGNAMTAADEAVALQAGIPLTNVDRGGETTRALARSVANQNPESRQALTNLAQDRFRSQAGRAVDFVRRVFGRVDDLDFQDQLRRQADLVNGQNYAAAENSPRAQQVFTPETQELLQSPAVQRAIDMVESRGSDLAAVAGRQPVRNPFRKGSDGRWRVVQKADGTLAVPNLRFWDQVKRNLDGMIGVAQRSGDKTEAAVLLQLKDKLVGSLDAAIPEYAIARRGAASAFGAEDAIDAGRKLARSNGQIPEAKRAWSKFTKAEKEAFSVGYASEIIDRINARGNGRDVIKALFDSPQALELNELVLGKTKAAQLEAYVRVEGIVDGLRGALGNSTTARQLAEMGLGGVAGGLYTQDWQGAIGGAAIARGARYAGERVDAKVMENVAKLLVSGTRSDLDRAVTNAALSPQWLMALRNLQMGIERSGGPLAASATN